VTRHGPMVFRVCRRVLQEDHGAEDAFQAAFLVLARKAQDIRSADRLAAWLYGVAYRVACEARKSRGRRLRRLQPMSALEQDPRPGPFDELSARELLALVDEEVSRL